MTDAADPLTAGGSQERRRLGELLVDAGVLTAEQLQRALESARTADGRKERVGQTVVRLGYATELDIARALARQLGLVCVESDILPVDEGVARAVPSAIAQRHEIVATGRDADGTLVVALADPTNIVALDDVRLATGARRIRRIVATRGAVEGALRKTYGFDQQTAVELLDGLDGGMDDATEDELLRAADDAPVVRLADGILTEALSKNASDVHLEPGPAGITVRYRIDGVLQRVMTVPRTASAALVSRLKLMAGMDIAERRRPQDGRSRLRGETEPVDLRVATLPGLHGETVVLRLLRKGSERPGVSDLGFSGEQLAAVRSAIERPQGLVLVTGPTGVGKTSTLYALLEHLSDDSRKIISLEDPVEYELEGVAQTQINEQIGLTFARALRTVLRQDPDIVMVGEIRDPETAELALQASLTGHLVLSTLHTNDATGAIVRLVDLGIPPYLIASSLTMVVAQRLVRRICARCGVDRPATDWQAAELHLGPRDLTGGFRVGGGCAACGHSGYRGRTGIFEVLMVDAQIRRLIAEGSGESAIRHAARQAGMRSLREDGIRRAMAGETTLDEVLRVTPSESAREGACPLCAQSVEPDYNLCPWCGADLRPDSCGTCNRQLARGWSLCPSCGTPTTVDKEGPAGALPRLLVVDDDPSVRAAVVAMLTGDYEVVEAASGDEALELVHRAAPDAVLLDVSMPGTDGWTVTRELRSRPVTQNLPVVLMTGEDDRDWELEGLRSGADDHLVKPLDPEVLHARLEAVLRRRAAH